MQVDITARHFTPSKKLKNMVHEKIKKIEKFNSKLMNISIVLTKEVNYEGVEIIAKGKGYIAVAHEKKENFEKAFISAIEKITIQIKKQHDRIVAH